MSHCDPDAVTRRRFLLGTIGSTAAFALLPATGRARQQETPQNEAGNAATSDGPVRSNGDMAQPLYRISLAQWSLHRMIRSGALDPLEFSRIAREEFGIDAVEYVSTFYRDKADHQKYINEMKRCADDHGVKSLLIMVDGEGALGDPDKQQQLQAVNNHHKWVDAAAALGCHSIRVNAHSSGSAEEQRDRVADGLSRLVEYGESRKINILVENHGGLSSNGQWLAAVMTQVDHPRCGTLPDFGNFRISDNETFDRYRGVELLMPFAKAVSAKSNDFDERGNEMHTDFRRMMKIVLDHKYHGYVGIEYEGNKLPELEGIRRTQALLERVRKELTAQGYSHQEADTELKEE